MYNPFKKEKKPINIKEVLRHIKELEEKIAITSKELKELKEKSKFCFQKIGIVRYNPFSEVGSNQSFSIALLDNNNDGVIITSLYARDGNRVYAKPVKNGNSEYTLSDEESKAVEEAVKKA